MGIKMKRLKNISRNKKGSLIDIIYAMVFLFAFALITIIAFYTHQQIKPEFMNNTESTAFNNTATTAAWNKTETVLKGFDYLYIFIMVGLLISTLILAFMIPTHPILFWLSTILLVFLIILSVIFSNIFEQIEADTNLNTTSASFPVINYVQQNYPIFILALSLIVILVMYLSGKQDIGGA